MTTTKPWLVGEHNPYSYDQKWALWPDPPAASGGRIMRILGFERMPYLRTFVRVNLIQGDKRWDARRAELAAFAHVAASEGAPMVLLGRKVSIAFGLPYKTFETFHDERFLVLPHPSGLNRAWNESDAVRRARDAFDALLSFHGLARAT